MAYPPPQQPSRWLTSRWSKPSRRDLSSGEKASGSCTFWGEKKWISKAHPKTVASHPTRGQGCSLGRGYLKLNSQQASINLKWLLIGFGILRQVGRASLSVYLMAVPAPHLPHLLLSAQL